MKKVTREEFHKAINKVDCIHAPESRIRTSVWMERRTGKRIGEVRSIGTLGTFDYYLYD